MVDDIVVAEAVHGERVGLHGGDGHDGAEDVCRAQTRGRGPNEAQKIARQRAFEVRVWVALAIVDVRPGIGLRGALGVCLYRKKEKREHDGGAEGVFFHGKGCFEILPNVRKEMILGGGNIRPHSPAFARIRPALLKN